MKPQKQLKSLGSIFYEPGQRVTEPVRPRESYPEYESRTVPWLNTAREARQLVTQLGPEAALAEINRRLNNEFFFTTRRYLPQLQQVVTHGFLLTPAGCQWALKPSRPGMTKGGCTFCEFQQAIDEIVGTLKISEEEFTALATSAMAVFEQTASIVRYFTGGSGLSPGEVPVGTMQTLAKMIAAAPTTKILGIESRVQFINEATLSIYQDILGPAQKSLEVMIGFETQNDEIRHGTALNKGMTRPSFEKGVSTALKAKARVAAYVMLMPVAWTESEAIKDCLATIKYLAQTGVQEAMLQARYSHHENIKCPSLWSITHVLWESRNFGIPVTLGDWRGEYPTPKVWPKNCGLCDDAVLAALDQWRLTLNPTHVDPQNLPNCACRNTWFDYINSKKILHFTA